MLRARMTTMTRRLLAALAADHHRNTAGPDAVGQSVVVVQREQQDAVDVLQQRREHLEVRVGGGLHRDVLGEECLCKSRTPLPVARMRSKHELRTALARHRPRPNDEALDEATLVRRIGRSVPGDEHDAP